MSLTRPQIQKLNDKRFEIHKYVQSHKRCTARQISNAVKYNITSTNMRLKELERDLCILSESSGSTTGKLYSSLTEPVKPVILEQEKRDSTRSSLLLSKAWRPGCIDLTV